MKIAFVSTILDFPWGGADTLWTRTAEAAQARGDEVLLAIAPSTAAHPRIAALRAAGARWLPCPPRPAPSLAARLGRKLGLPVDPERRLNAALAAFRPDCVIFSQGGTDDLLLHPRLVAWLQATRTRYRVIANWQAEHPQLSSDARATARAALAGAERVFFVSTRNLAVSRRFFCAPLPQACVVHNPLRWTPADRPDDWPAPGPARLATVSRLDHGKGLHLLLDALAELGPDLPDWLLTIHGTGPAEADLRERIAWLGLGQRVRLAGHVAGLRTIWGDHEVMCSPALDDGVPMTIPEAMLCSRPVLATAVGGAEDWLDDDRTGWLCPAPTLPLLAATLRRAFARRADWPALGAAAAEAAQARYRPDDFQLLLAP